MYVTFPLDVEAFRQRRSAMSHAGSKCNLLPVNDHLIIRPSIRDYLDRYHEDFGANSLKLTLSTLSLEHIVRLHRIMTFYRGDVLMLGRVGMHLQALVKLALYMSGFELLATDMTSSRADTVFDHLRSGFCQAGLEGKGCALILTDTDLKDPAVMEAVNAVVVCGELPLLFSNDELQGLLCSLVPNIKRDFPNCDTDPMEYFTARVRRYMRLILCLTDNNLLLTSHVQ